MNFIKKIFQEKIDGQVHQQFVRFGKGTFERRALISIKKGNVIKISTSFELANDLVLFVFELVDKARCSGIIFSKQSIPALGNASKKAILFEYKIDKELTKGEIEEISKVAYCMLLDCSADGIVLKTKKKRPKPGKSAETKVDDKFCSLELDKRYEKQVAEEFLFDMKEAETAKKIQISHDFLIDEIILPKGEKDFEKMRLLAKRKGRIVRKSCVDGKETRDEKAFIA